MDNTTLYGVMEKAFFKKWENEPYAFRIKADGKNYFCHLDGFKRNLYESSPEFTRFLKEGDKVQFKLISPGNLLAINVCKKKQSQVLNNNLLRLRKTVPIQFMVYN